MAKKVLLSNPESEWWEVYFTPMEDSKMEKLTRKFGLDKNKAIVIGKTSLMEAKHTPGPWEVVSGSVYTTITKVPIAHMDRNSGNGTLPVERDTNARLISKAWLIPEVIETVKGFQGSVCMIHCDEYKHTRGCKEITALLAKLEKD